MPTWLPGICRRARWYTWVIAILGVDLLYYCYHRFAHRVRLIWATHQAHHSSQYFNFATALRQKWNNSGEILMWIPLPLLGIPPWLVFVSFSVNLIYQFWVHTERIGRMWAPFEFVFNTPSHHRVHHGMDAEYLDKNYGGIFILWDRLFGSFRQETFRPHYGLTKQVEHVQRLEIADPRIPVYRPRFPVSHASARPARLRLRPSGLAARSRHPARGPHPADAVAVTHGSMVSDRSSTVFIAASRKAPSQSQDQ